MPSEKEQRQADDLKAFAWDMRQLEQRHVSELRKQGLDDLAEKIEDLAKNAQAAAEEFDA
jgi:hypothetical protein